MGLESLFIDPPCSSQHPGGCRSGPGRGPREGPVLPWRHRSLHPVSPGFPRKGGRQNPARESAHRDSPFLLPANAPLSVRICCNRRCSVGFSGCRLSTPLRRYRPGRRSCPRCPRQAGGISGGRPSPLPR
ncbi:MAG: hypothetical protein MZV64_71105 [Ignavibacteriales bacterium]|nr:hypothetical protein [Ignavibacteriales bacterium]